ncbi:hypothetical protein [Alcanivorax jadensis]|uniref:hypothetical protein n=1 Tax=Alcanivorax jadensis TaxID=64988 RepID=UPI0035686806
MKQQQATRAVRAPGNEAMAQLARVEASAEGVPTLALQDSGERVTPVEAVRNLSPLQVGDTVLVQPTRQGWVITAQLGGLDASPFQFTESGALSLRCDKGLQLQVGDASIAITPAGCITVDGKEIHTLASGLQRIMGGLVQIN